MRRIPAFFSFLTAFALLASLVAAGGADAQPSGHYQARPGPVVVCQDLVACDVLQLEGSFFFDVLALPFPGSGDPVIRLVDVDLRLQPAPEGLFTGFVGGSRFPRTGHLPLEAAEIEGLGDRWRLTSPAGAADDYEFELLPSFASGTGLLLRGTYAEGSGEERFTYEVGGVLFDWTGPGPPALLLGDNRFSIAVTWEDFAGGSGNGTPVAFDGRSGHFWFFSSRNPELTVKVIDGCATFGRWWFFAAGLTNVGVEIVVTDQALGGPKIYRNPLGRPFEPILDTVGFPCIP